MNVKHYGRVSADESPLDEAFAGGLQDLGGLRPGDHSPIDRCAGRLGATLFFTVSGTLTARKHDCVFMARTHHGIELFKEIRAFDVAGGGGAYVDAYFLHDSLLSVSRCKTQ